MPPFHSDASFTNRPVPLIARALVRGGSDPLSLGAGACRIGAPEKCIQPTDPRESWPLMFFSLFRNSRAHRALEGSRPQQHRFYLVWFAERRPDDVFSSQWRSIEFNFEGAHRIRNGVGDHNRRCDCAAFADPFYPKRIERRRRVLVD
jgi:hypothetical protein